MNKEDNKKKRLKSYYGLLVTLICIVGVSFAWFRLYLSQSENNVISTRTCFDTTLTEDTSKITLTDAFPISDEDGLKQTPFTFTLKNNCSSYVKVYITINSKYRESTSTSYLKDDYVKANLSAKGTTTGQSTLLANDQLIDLENNNKGYILVSTGLKANEEKSYDLRVWVDSETTLEQGLNKSWEGKIVVVGEAASGKNLSNIILADNEIKEPLTVPGKEVSAYTADNIESETEDVESLYQSYYITYGTGWKANGIGFDLTGTAVTNDTYANSYSSLVGKYLTASSLARAGSSTAGTMKTTTNLKRVYYVTGATSDSLTYKEITSNKNTTEALLASTEDDYGTTYYFRGAVKNNYVEFANKCWRIVRITGDGSVKLVLHNDNISNVSSPCASSNNSTSAAFAHYNGAIYKSAFNSNNGDNAKVGFMYGTAGATDYASAHANINKSTILTNLETWYENNLISYEDKLADTIWCNDKSIVSGELGYGNNSTYYATNNRLYSTNQPTLICPNDNNGGKLSKFTVDDVTNGNGDLTYKIGLLTADEIAFSGLSTSGSNSSTYLQENADGTGWWSLSADRCVYTNVTVWNMYAGNLSGSYVISNDFGLRPAIALASETLISGGTGTSEDPYVVK